MPGGSDSVRIVLFDRDASGRFLILCEADDAGNWKLPGGKFETGETPDEAAARELTEEVGLEPRDVDLTRAVELINDDGLSRRFIYGGIVDPRMVRPSVEVAQVQWVTDKTVPVSKNHGHISSAVGAARKIVNSSSI